MPGPYGWNPNLHIQMRPPTAQANPVLSNDADPLGWDLKEVPCPPTTPVGGSHQQPPSWQSSHLSTTAHSASQLGEGLGFLRGVQVKGDEVTRQLWNRFSLGLWLPEELKWGQRKCCRLVDFSCNSNLKTRTWDTSNSLFGDGKDTCSPVMS